MNLIGLGGDAYQDRCEEIWAQWLEGHVPGSSVLKKRFDLDAAPEPYLWFEEGADPLVVVTTNPGATMDHQRRPKVIGGESFLHPGLSYSEAAAALGAFYKRELTDAAKRRIDAQGEISNQAGFDGLLQVECIPWHSASLSGKESVIQALTAEPAFQTYVKPLREFLFRQPTIALSAVSTRSPIGIGSIQKSVWLKWQTDLMNLRLDKAVFLPLVRKEEKVTSGAVIDRTGGAVKAMVLMMGGNHWPNSSARRALAEEIRRNRGQDTNAVFSG